MATAEAEHHGRTREETNNQAKAGPMQIIKKEEVQRAVQEAGIRGQVQHRRKLKAKADLKATREAIQDVDGERLPRKHTILQPS